MTNNRLHLRLADASDEESVMEYRELTLDDGEMHINGSAALEKFDSYAEWLNRNILDRDDETVQQGNVPSSTFLAFDEQDNLVGMIDLRHRFNPFLLQYGGNIGYSIAPSKRRKGYGHEMLMLCLLEAKKIGLEKVLITCDKENEASRNTILSGGGVFDNEVIRTIDGGNSETLQRYWITIK